MAKKDKGITYIVLASIMLIIVLYVTLQLIFVGKDKSNRTQCPYKIEGNSDAYLIIKYVDSPYCVWCWIEEPVLKRLVAEKGDSFRLERYDIRYCDDIVAKYEIYGTPFFIFGFDGEMTEFVHSGYISGNSFNNVLCEVAGSC